MAEPWTRSFLRQLQFQEAVASVSLSHADNCACDICKAAQGDEAALIRVMEGRQQVGEDRG